MSDALQRQQRLIEEYQQLQTGQHFPPTHINQSNSNPEFDEDGNPLVFQLPKSTPQSTGRQTPVEEPVKPDLPDYQFPTTTPQIAFYGTLPEQKITLAFDRKLTDNKPINSEYSYQEFFDLLQHPSASENAKDGPGYMNGPCHGLRRKTNVPHYCFAVLDGDASLDKDGNKEEGAPSPVSVHKALRELNISHCIYTTFSHSTKGARWRLLIPSLIHNPAQLRGVLIYIAELLRDHAGLPVYLTPESTVWGNRWHMPRTAFHGAPFYAAYHFGYSVEAASAAAYYKLVDITNQEVREYIPPAQTTSEASPYSLIEQYCSYFPLPDVLLANGYSFHGQTITTDHRGEDRPTLRFRKPGSESSPGVVVFWDNDMSRWRGYTHHATDLMSSGRSFDAFDILQYSSRESSHDQLLHQAATLVKEAIVQEMGVKYPTLLENNKFKIAFLSDMAHAEGEDYRFLSFDDWAAKKANHPGIFIPSRNKDGLPGLKLTNLAQWWKTAPERKDYDGVTFEPVPVGGSYSREVQKGSTTYFNLFGGWPIKPEPGDCDLIEWHLREAICGGQDVEYQYLLDWLAHLFQFPAEKPNVAVVLRGGKGVGKTLIMSRLVQALGNMGTVIANARQLTGDFNSHLRNKLLGVVEESFWAGSKNDEGPLKHLISDERTTFEKKGIEAEDGRSFIRLILITNNTWAAPASEDERRFFIPSVGDAAKQRQREEGNFFERLSRQLDGGGLHALVHQLMQRRIKKRDVRYPPDTEGLVQQKLLSLSGPKAWLYDSLRAGALYNAKSDTYLPLLDYPHNNPVEMGFMVECCNAYSARGDGQRSALTRVETLLKDVFGSLKLDFQGGRQRVVMPSLPEMRTSFEGYVGAGISWGTL